MFRLKSFESDIFLAPPIGITVFIRTLPVRVRWNKEMFLADLLQYMRKDSIMLLARETDSLSDIFSYIQVSSMTNSERDIFDHILVFENYPLDSLINIAPAHAKIAAIMNDILKTPIHNISDDFFLLGGQSLSAIQLLLRLNKEFNCTLSMRNIMSNGTVEALAKCIERLNNVNLSAIH